MKYTVKFHRNDALKTNDMQICMFNIFQKSFSSFFSSALHFCHTMDHAYLSQSDDCSSHCSLKNHSSRFINRWCHNLSIIIVLNNKRCGNVLKTFCSSVHNNNKDLKEKKEIEKKRNVWKIRLILYFKL